MPAISFLDLPWEIRQIILKFYFQGSHQTPFARNRRRGLRRYDRWNLDSRDTSSLLKTCKTLYEQGLRLYYQEVYFCRSRQYYKPQFTNLIEADGIRLNIRKFIDFPLFVSGTRMGLKHWTSLVEYFPALELIIFGTDQEIWPNIESHFLGRTNQSGLQMGWEDNTAAKMGEIFNEIWNIQPLLKTRPNLTIGSIAHFTSCKGLAVYHHSICLVDIGRGIVIKNISSHSSCIHADEHRSLSHEAALIRPCDPWDCEWILPRENLIDLTVEDEAANKACEARINLEAYILSSSVFTHQDKAEADLLYDKKVKNATVAAPGRSTPWTSSMLAFMERYRKGEWDDWCPHGEGKRGTCSCPRITPAEIKFRTKR